MILPTSDSGSIVGDGEADGSTEAASDGASDGATDGAVGAPAPLFVHAAVARTTPLINAISLADFCIDTPPGNIRLLRGRESCCAGYYRTGFRSASVAARAVRTHAEGRMTDVIVIGG